MIPVLYEDNHLLVVVKPAGIPVQADDSHDMDMLTLLKAYIAEKYNKPGAVYLGLVHRLDRPVGGVMVFARTSKAASRLSDTLRRNGMEKEYLCVVVGKPAPGRYEDWLLKNPTSNTSCVVRPHTPGGKEAALLLSPLAERNGLSLCRVQLLTGRSHQIRVQLSSRGTPLWGDARYNPAAKPGQDIALFCHRLAFPHPVSKERLVFSALPTGNVWYPFQSMLNPSLVQETAQKQTQSS